MSEDVVTPPTTIVTASHDPVGTGTVASTSTVADPAPKDLTPTGQTKLDPSDSAQLDRDLAAIDDTIRALGALRDQFLRQEANLLAGVTQARQSYTATLGVFGKKYGLDPKVRWDYDHKTGNFLPTK